MNLRTYTSGIAISVNIVSRSGGSSSSSLFEYCSIAQTYMQTNINVHATNIQDKWTLENRLAERTSIVNISKSL